MAHIGNKGPLGLKPDNAGRAAKFAVKKGAASEPAALKALTKQVSPPSGLGETVAKPPKKRKPVRKVSAKRAAYLASPERQEGLAHMERVKNLPCVCCGRPPPNDAHHCTGDNMPRNDMRVIPLCHDDHRGPQGYHNAKQAWVAKYGPDYMMLPTVAAMLQK